MPKLNLNNAPTAQMLKSVQEKTVKELNSKTIINIPLSEIDENEDNEKIFNMTEIKALAKNIKEEGFIGAIEVYEKEDGRYEICSGHRRYRAMLMLNEETIPAIVSPMPSDLKKRRTLISSNINIREMSAMDIARALEYHYQTLMLEDSKNKKKSTSEKYRSSENRLEVLSEYFNLSVMSVTRYLKLNKLMPDLQTYISEGKIPWTSIVSVADLEENEQKKVCDEVTKQLKTKMKLSAKDIDTILLHNTTKKKEPQPRSVTIDRSIYRIHKQLSTFAKESITVSDKEILLKNIAEIEEYIKQIKEKL